MKTVNMAEAKAQLSKLVQGAVDGEPFVIAKAGRRLVRVETLREPGATDKSRIGFLEGQFSVPDDFDTVGRAEMEAMFGTDSRSRCSTPIC